jgi:hypothetical protein
MHLLMAQAEKLASEARLEMTVPGRGPIRY